MCPPSSLTHQDPLLCPLDHRGAAVPRAMPTPDFHPSAKVAKTVAEPDVSMAHAQQSQSPDTGLGEASPAFTARCQVGEQAACVPKTPTPRWLSQGEGGAGGAFSGPVNPRLLW